MEMLPGTRNRDGFIDVAVHVDKDNSDTTFAVEHWDNGSDHEADMGWRVERGDVDKLIPVMAEPPEFGYYDIIDD